MREDIRLHGYMADNIEYFAFSAGWGAHKRFFFNIEHDGDDRIRFFLPGSEITLGPEGLAHKGGGGTFCEYMFGVDQPVTDMAKEDVKNRLVMFGAHFDYKAGRLKFSNSTSGSLSYDKIFFEGNALCNYFFMVHSTRLSEPLKRQQEQLLRMTGKAIKRANSVASADDNGIIEEVFPLLNDPDAHFILLRLVNRHHKEYGDLFRTLYFNNKKIADVDFARLTSMAAGNRIDRYQQERIRIDVMYKHPDNKRIVDEYQNILVACNRKGEINRLENARLTRLKTLSVRNKIPGALFSTLDEMLKSDKRVVGLEESEYISETRQIMGSLFPSGPAKESEINGEDMVKLLRAKKKAAENRDHAFEEILLDTSRDCDEKTRDGADISLLERFSYIITFFDRYDSVSAIINQLAFMENVRISEDMIRSILVNKGEFDQLQSGLFEELFIDVILRNRYAGNFGRKKVSSLMEGLVLIEEKRLTPLDLLTRLKVINDEERLYNVVLKLARERIKYFYSRYSTKSDQESLRKEILHDLSTSGVAEGELPWRLFDEVIVAIKKEAVYIQNLLPKIVAEKDVLLREDFLDNSGLDRFYVEELEREYFALNDLDVDDLYEIRKGLN